MVEIIANAINQIISVTNRIVSATNPIFWTTNKIFSPAKTIVVATETCFSKPKSIETGTEIIASLAKQIIPVTNPIFSMPKKILSSTKSIFSEDLSFAVAFGDTWPATLPNRRDWWLGHFQFALSFVAAFRERGHVCVDNWGQIECHELGK